MRISGGLARGVALQVDKKAVHRPAMDKLRQSIFSSLGAAVDGASALDLFAGTGSYGLEALSRGAASACFVELNRRAAAMIRANLAIVSKSMRSPLDASIVVADVAKWTPPDKAYDLIFADPPYRALDILSSQLFPLFEAALRPGGIVVFEAPGQFEPQADGWRLRKRLGKGIDQATACLLERV